MPSNRFAKMVGPTLPGVASGTPPRPPKLTAKAPKATAKPVTARRGMSANLGKFLHRRGGK